MWHERVAASRGKDFSGLLDYQYRGKRNYGGLGLEEQVRARLIILGVAGWKYYFWGWEGENLECVGIEFCKMLYGKGIVCQ